MGPAAAPRAAVSGLLLTQVTLGVSFQAPFQIHRAGDRRSFSVSHTSWLEPGAEVQGSFPDGSLRSQGRRQSSSIIRQNIKIFGLKALAGELVSLHGLRGEFFSGSQASHTSISHFTRLLTLADTNTSHQSQPFGSKSSGFRSQITVCLYGDGLIRGVSKRCLCVRFHPAGLLSEHLPRVWDTRAPVLASSWFSRESQMLLLTYKHLRGQ